SREARSQGVRPGMTCAHALALLPDLIVREHRPEDDDAALLGLARWATAALSPRVALAPGAGTSPQRTAAGAASPRRAAAGAAAGSRTATSPASALLLDAVGLEPVHGDEAALLRKARAGLAGLGFSSRAALADTPLAALALARAGPRPDVIAPPGEQRAALEPLPPGALPLGAPALGALARLGVDTIGGLLRLPRAGLPARLGEEVLEALDRALGARDDPLRPVALPDVLRERLETTGETDAGTDRLVDLAFALEALAERAAARLDAEGRGARALALVLEREDARPARWALRLAAPVAGARTLVRVLHQRLERQDLSVPVTALELTITETSPLVLRQAELFEADVGARAATSEDLACLLGRLEGLLGPRQVLRVDLRADHRPERAHAARPASGLDPPAPGSRPGGGAHVAAPPGPRPTRLLERPAPISVLVDDPHGPPRALRLEGDVVPLASATGPERVETGFWDGAEVRRDYWVVAGEDGRAWWVFRDLAGGGWFLHGVFD
ncbi:MAG: DNA polymerase Y family protein, partial [Planctomycetes bacterium]|nr:DNA polymerase Y family protein [Planctomycetota bacterium]